jgi:hypothetical protein
MLSLVVDHSIHEQHWTLEVEVTNFQVVSLPLVLSFPLEE